MIFIKKRRNLLFQFLLIFCDAGGKAEAQFEKTDMTCELCGKPVIIRPGKYGAFYACEDYPTCKFTKPILRDIGVPCPKCGKKIVQKRGKNRMIFYSCEDYPACDFSSWDIPQTETCPNCGDLLYRKKGKDYIFCHNKDCGYKREVEPMPVGGDGNEDTL